MLTVTSTVPADSAGETAVKCVEETNVTPVAAVEPNLTVAPDTNPVPVIVTDVPPAVGPAVGLRPVTDELSTVSVKVCVAFGDTPLEAVIVNG